VEAAALGYSLLSARVLRRFSSDFVSGFLFGAFVRGIVSGKR
jgi:hypothetical protein